jgi:hypothetical protein
VAVIHIFPLVIRFTNILHPKTVHNIPK